MKFKTLLVSALVGLSLTACNDDSDRSGTYANSNNDILNIEKTKDGKKYRVEGKKIFLVITYEKDGKLLETRNDNLIGTFNGTEFIDSKNGEIYKKKL